MAYTKTTWVNDKLPSINATNLNKIEQGIYDAHEDITNIYEKNIYSTDETVIGKWIDGKPIYRKIFKYTNIQNQYDLNIDFNTVIDFEVIVDHNINGYRYRRKLNHLSEGDYCHGFIRDNTLQLRYINDVYPSINSIILIIEYTKTTD